MIIEFIIKTEFGEFRSDEMEVTEDQYSIIKEKSKSFYDGGYEMYLPNGFVVIPQDVVKKSILVINIINK